MLLGAEIKVAEAAISKEVSQLSKRRIFGLGDKKVSWNDVFARYLIMDMLNCSGGRTLDKCDLDCLKGKMTDGLTNSCC